MIESACVQLQNELQDFLRTVDPSVNLILSNIGQVNSPEGDDLRNSVVMTLINIEEKNAFSFFTRLRKFLGIFTPNSQALGSPDAHLLIAANFSGTDYRLALRRIDFVINFFKQKQLFVIPAISSVQPERRFRLEYRSLTLRDTSLLWSSLGGVQLPSLLFKIKFEVAGN